MSLRSPFPRLQSLFAIAEREYAHRRDLQAAFPSPHGVDYWYWLMWHGVAEVPGVAENLYPFPGDVLRDRVIGTSSGEAFHRGGLVDFRRIECLLREAGYDFSRAGTVLDFGCGCARILRFFGIHTQTTTFVGADVDDEAICWCRRHIDFATFTSVPPDPPTPFPPSAFDAIFAFSVFSHFPEDRQDRWLAELHRISAPGAIVVITTQGPEVMRQMIARQREGLYPPKEILEPATRAIHIEGFRFFPYPQVDTTTEPQARPITKTDAAADGTAFVLEPYIRARWTRYFNIVAHHAAPDGWQDYTLLLRKP